MKKIILISISVILLISSCKGYKTNNDKETKKDTLSYIEKKISFKCDSITKSREAIYKPLYFSKEYAIDVSKKDLHKLFNAINSNENFLKCIEMPLFIMKYKGSPSEYLKLAQFMDDNIKRLKLTANTYAIFHRCEIKDEIKGIKYTELLVYEIDSTKTKIIGVCDEEISENQY